MQYAGRHACTARAMALCLLLAASTETSADREVLTIDCNGHLHIMSGTPAGISFHLPRAPSLFDHVLTKFKSRLECHCHEPMEEEEFLRKYHPLTALLNILSPRPNKTVSCPTEIDFLHFSRSDAGHLVLDAPCSYGSLVSAGCKMKFKRRLNSTSLNLDLDLALGMKMCKDSYWPYTRQKLLVRELIYNLKNDMCTKT